MRHGYYVPFRMYSFTKLTKSTNFCLVFCVFKFTHNKYWPLYLKTHENDENGTRFIWSLNLFLFVIYSRKQIPHILSIH
jgi:hypothetical protein